MRLADKIAIVTGASRGIGRSIALELGRLGATVILVARTDTRRADLPGTLGETEELIASSGGRAISHRADLLEPGASGQLIDFALRECGQIDILVNNAADTGRPVFQTLWDSDPATWRRSVELNVNVPWDLIHFAAPSMRARQSGLIVNITSGAGMLLDSPLPSVGDPGWLGAVYPATKAALNQATRYLGEELRPFGVTLLAVDPGFTRTEAVEHFSSEYGVDLSEAHTMASVSAGIGRLASSPDLPTYASRILRYDELLTVPGS